MTLLLALLTIAPANAVPMFGGYGVANQGAAPTVCSYCQPNRASDGANAQDDMRSRQDAWTTGRRYFPVPPPVVVQVAVVAPTPPPPPPEPTAWQLRTQIEPGELILLAELKSELTPLSELADAFTPLAAE